MESGLLQILEDAQSPAQGPREHAERQLKGLYANTAFPPALCNIAINTGVPVPTRQAALLVLKTFVLACWSPDLDEFEAGVQVDDASKALLRNALLGLATSENVEKRIQSAACYVVSKIANADYPDAWPDLLQILLDTIARAGDTGVHGALKVLAELVEGGLDEEQFSKLAPEISRLHMLASDGARPLASRALAVSVYRGAYDMLEWILESDKTAVKAFAEQSSTAWLPFFVETLQARPPPRSKDAPGEQHRGLLALKIQVVKTLMRIRILFPSIISPQSQALFSALWDELSDLTAIYQEMYIDSEEEGRLEDADGLPYTLDTLVLEDLDFMQSCIRAPILRKSLESQLGGDNRDWLLRLVSLLTSYARITCEEDGMWQIDANIFLSEETSVTSNYTSRTACGDFVVKLGQWLPEQALHALLIHSKQAFESGAQWQIREASLFLLGQILADWQDQEKSLDDGLAQAILDIVKYSMEQQDIFLRARGFLTGGMLAKSSSPSFCGALTPILEATISSISHDREEIVQVACVQGLGYYLQSLPTAITRNSQQAIISTLSHYLQSKDAGDLVDAEDLMLALLEALRSVLLMDVGTCIAGDGLNVLFRVAHFGAANMQIAAVVAEVFEEVGMKVKSLGSESYNELITKVLPSLIGVFNLGHVTGEDTLLNLAARLVSILAEHASAPLPSAIVPALLPKLFPLLLASTDSDLLQYCTSCLTHTLRHDPGLLSWHDPTPKGPTSQKSGLECVLMVIDRLLGLQTMDDAALEVGNLASALVATAGDTQQLIPYLTQILHAVAVRLSTATQTTLIQSLALVFARLTIASAREVVEFLAQLGIAGVSGLHVLVPKWLDNTPDFAGFEEIRTNIAALARIYELHDPRLDAVPCKGELVIEQDTSGCIMTRSRAKAQPPRWTEVAAPVKIVKVLIAELSAQMASGGATGMGTSDAVASAAGGEGADDDEGYDDVEDDEDEEDGEWEDEPGTGVLDLGLGMTKAQLMGLGGEEGSFSVRQADDETQGFLVDFFRRQATLDVARFEGVFMLLSAEEKDKLRGLG